MKAIGFFCAVFFSMLFVFLLATGEFKRWVSGKGDHYSVKVDLSADPSESGENLIRFDFYNVELGRRSFSIRAEFRQDDFQIETQIESIRELEFHNGVIEIPVSEEKGAAEPPAGEGLDRPIRNVLLSFDTATYLRGEDSDAGNGRFQVLLKDGKGTTDDGTEFEFEEVVFSDDVPEKPDGSRSGFLLHSDKPVSVQNPSLQMRSPAGFQGVLESHGLRSFTFLPPVRALLNPRHPALLKMEPAVLDKEGSTESAGASQGKEAGELVGGPGEPATRKDRKPSGEDAQETPATSDEHRTLIAVSCEGPLSLEFEERKRDPQGSRPSRTLVTFQKDVFLYAVDDTARLESLPPPEGNRFECQELQIELESSGQQLAPRRAVATWKDGRVRAVLHRETAGEPYTIDGERLEWVLREPPGEVAPEGAYAPRAPGERQLLSEAVLFGQPTLRGQDMEFVAERAVFHLHESRVLLENVKGDLRHGVQDGKESEKDATGTEPALSPPRVEVWEEESPGGGVGPPSEKVPEPDLQPGGDGEQQRIPEHWRMEADEVEFVFSASKEKGGSSSIGHALSSFQARSREPAGVVIESIPEEKEEAATADAVDDGEGTFRITGKTLTYVEGEKKFTLDGTSEVKPRFSKTDNWIEARRLVLFTEVGLVRFEGAVHARVEDLGDLTRKTGQEPSSDSNAETPKEGPSITAPDGLEEASFELTAETLTIRRKETRNALRDLWGSGTPQSPLVVTSLAAPWFQLSGPELYWDQEKGLAQLASISGEPGQPESMQRGMARVEFENGELTADRIRFDRAGWKAYLSDQVQIRVFDRGKPTATEPLEIRTARAVVEFFPEFEERGPPGSGPLAQLRRIKNLHAYSAPDHPIEISRSDFVGRAEECTWNALVGELRFFGAGLQEIVILHEDFQGPTRAREVVYDQLKQRVTLRGEVQGHIVQSAVPTDLAGDVRGAKVQPAAGKATEDESPMVWEFNTALLEIQLREDPQLSRLALHSLRARDKVYLRNEALSVQLRGDDLVYDDTTRKIHVFSPDGRPQTLLCDRFGSLSGSSAASETDPSSNRPKADSRMDKVHKIVSQEIWLLLYENPHATPRRGEPREWLLAEFNRDVMASFYLPRTRADDKVKDLDVGDTWKMVAEKLTLHIDPSQTLGSGARQRLQRLIPWAVAAGGVVFTTGSYQATADRAIYEDPYRRVTLIGSPARLSQDSRTVEQSEEMLLRMEGNEVVYTPGRQRSRPPIPKAPSLPE